jgi:hypothetical protein
VEFVLVKKDESGWFQLFGDKKLLMQADKCDPYVLLKLFETMGLIDKVSVFETNDEQLKEFTPGEEEFLDM